jgi:hypothetical protein
MNGAGQWRCYLGWMPIHTVTTISAITRGHLRQVTGKKRTSTFSSPHTVSGSCVCESVFKSCLLIQMTIPSDGTNFTQSIEFILSDQRPTWPDARADDWWVRLILGRFHIVLSAHESDEPRSGCWDIWYPVRCSAHVIVWHSWCVYSSAPDAGTARRKTRAPLPWNSVEIHIQFVSHSEDIS